MARIDIIYSSANPTIQDHQDSVTGDQVLANVRGRRAGFRTWWSVKFGKSILVTAADGEQYGVNINSLTRKMAENRYSRLATKGTESTDSGSTFQTPVLPSQAKTSAYSREEICELSRKAAKALLLDDRAYRTIYEIMEAHTWTISNPSSATLYQDAITGNVTSSDGLHSTGVEGWDAL